MVTSTRIFGSPKCSQEIEQSILHYLVNDKDHPQASSRFGIHFLAFPLLHVNRHLRQQVAKLLYKIAYKTERQALLYPALYRLTGEAMVLAPSRICNIEGVSENDDPRQIFKDAPRHVMECVEYRPTSLDHTSPSLLVSFEAEKQREAHRLPAMWEVEVGKEGREYWEWDTCLQAVSTAWFERTGEPIAALDWEGHAFIKDDEQEWGARKEAFNKRALGRHGLKSTVPLPIDGKGLTFDIALPPIIHPKWGTRGSPGPHMGIDMSLDRCCPEWKFTYKSEVFDLKPVLGEHGELLPGYDYIRSEEEKITSLRKDMSTFDIQLIQVPLLDLLRPPISHVSVHYEYQHWLYDGF